MQIGADSFDSYGSINDFISRYAAVNNTNGGAYALTTSTAFGTGLALYANGNSSGSNSVVTDLVVPLPAWGTNETTLYGSVRLRYNNATAQAQAGFFMTFYDGATAQCTIRWGGDGSINLYSGLFNGTLLQSNAAVFGLNTHDSWQFRVIIGTTTGTPGSAGVGSIELRKNGSTSNAITWTGNNRPSGVSQINNVVFGFWQTQVITANWFIVDDLFLNSGSGVAPNGWPGDLRAVQQIPAAATQTQFTPGGSAATSTLQTTNSTLNIGAVATANTLIFYGRYSPARTGTCTGLTVQVNAGFTGHLALALYDATGASSGPGNLVAATTAITNPVSGSNTALFAAPVTLTGGQNYYFAMLSDTTWSPQGINTLVFYGTAGQTYGSGFPSSTSVAVSSTNNNTANIQALVSWSNTGCVQDAAEDGDVSYIASGTVGQEDIFTLTAVPTTYSVVGVEYYVWWRKSDAGARTAQLSVQANGSADTAEITNAALGNSYGYSTKFLATDPTGAGWTPTTANGAKIGISVTA